VTDGEISLPLTYEEELTFGFRQIHVLRARVHPPVPASAAGSVQRRGPHVTIDRADLSKLAAADLFDRFHPRRERRSEVRAERVTVVIGTSTTPISQPLPGNPDGVREGAGGGAGGGETGLIGSYSRAHVDIWQLFAAPALFLLQEVERKLLLRGLRVRVGSRCRASSSTGITSPGTQSIAGALHFKPMTVLIGLSLPGDAAFHRLAASGLRRRRVVASVNVGLRSA
jgi:hypothetical protein